MNTENTNEFTTKNDFTNTVALVTGAASGMGEATARRIAALGGSVALLDLPNSRGEEVAADIGNNALFIPTNVTAPDEVAAAFAATLERFDRLDYAISCAGAVNGFRVVDKEGNMFPLNEFERLVDINLVGLFDVVRNAAKAMMTNEPNEDGQRGVIINISSIAGIEGQAGQAAYASSKGAVVAMTLPLARDLASLGVRVNTICPGIFDTGMLAGVDDKIRDRMSKVHVFPKRLGRPSEVALLVTDIIGNPVLNGEVIRLDAATRLGHG